MSKDFITRRCKECTDIIQILKSEADNLPTPFVCDVCLKTGFKMHARKCAVCGKKTNNYKCDECNRSLFKKRNTYAEDITD